jgi:hypothetical protein
MIDDLVQLISDYRGAFLETSEDIKYTMREAFELADRS